VNNRGEKNLLAIWMVNCLEDMQCDQELSWSSALLLLKGSHDVYISVKNNKIISV
jgi:hypothetical protein